MLGRMSESSTYKPKVISPHETIGGTGGKTFGDFWSWAYSDVLSNGNRSVFAEYIVGLALGVAETPRIEWHSVDFCYQGKGIEVKASAYVQAWGTADRESRICYDIGKKFGWDAERNVTLTTQTRSAACYVFCLYPEKNRSLCDLSNVAQWRFYVLPTQRIEAECPDQKTIGISRLQSLAKEVDYAGLKQAVDEALLST